ncbi:hypothetical protein JTB14_025941 [Gonioctena quinquepunctata]|nr:hypothetical protein JTB14_025941 [Gonioctena quinquepunctata]
MEQVEFKRVIVLENNGSNYPAWKFQIIIILRTAGVYEIVDKSRLPGASEESKKKWSEDDLKAQRVIVTSISERVITHLIACKSSADMWTRIQALFGKTTEANLHSLQQRFYAYVFKNDGVAAHIADLENLSHELKSCGDEISENMLVNKILMTLPESFKHFHSAWDSSPEKTLNSLTSRLIAEEERIRNRDKRDEGMVEAFSAEKSNWRSKFPRRIENESKERRFAKKNVICNYCKKRGHCERDCWFKKKKVEQRSSASSTRSNYALMSNTEGESKCDWYLDSGASQHMTFNRSWFKNYEKLNIKEYIVIGDGTRLAVEGRGSIAVNIRKKNNDTISCTIERVLHVPDLKCSLFSASAVADKGYTIITNKRQCKIIKDNGIIILGERDGNLFRVKMDLEKDTQAYVGSKENRSLKLWHENVTQCRKILKNFGFEYNENEEFQCESCIYGKQTREKFPNSTTKSQGEFTTKMEEKSIQTMSVIFPKSPENSELVNGTIENEIQEEITNEIVEHVDESTENRTLRDRNVLKVPTKYNDYVCMLSDDDVNFSQAMKSKEWKKAMKKEIDAQLQNQTWELTSLPHNKKSLNCMWIYKLKSNGLHKARGKGYVQWFIKELKQFAEDVETVFL